MVDGSGLENRHTRKGIGGSNPSLSATQSGLQRNLAVFLLKSLEIGLVSQILPEKSITPYPAGKAFRPFF